MSALTEDSWILRSASAFILLRYHMSCSLWKTPLYTLEKMKFKKANHIIELL